PNSGDQRSVRRCSDTANPSLATDRERDTHLSGLWFLTVFMVAILGAMAARGQDGQYGQGHAEDHDWYKDLKQPDTGISCCNGQPNGPEGDCRPTRAYLSDDGVWYALSDGRWVPVPPIEWC